MQCILILMKTTQITVGSVVTLSTASADFFPGLVNQILEVADTRLAGGEYVFHVVPVGRANDGTARREVYREDLVAYVPRH